MAVPNKRKAFKVINYREKVSLCYDHIDHWRAIPLTTGIMPCHIATNTPICQYHITICHWLWKFPAKCIGTNITSEPGSYNFDPWQILTSRIRVSTIIFFLDIANTNFSYPQLLRHHPMLRTDQFPGDNTMHIFSIVRHDISRGVTYTSISPWLDISSFYRVSAKLHLSLYSPCFTPFPTV